MIRCFFTTAVLWAVVLGSPFVASPVLAQTPGLVQAESPLTCISTVDSCVTVPVTLDRTDTTPILGMSITFTLSTDLEFCEDLSLSVQQGALFTDHGPSLIFRQDHGDGSYTIDQTVLGNCGPTGSGTIFTIELTSASADAIGEVTIIETSVRDCINGTIPTDPGDTGFVTIDNSPPVEMGDLASTPVSSGNDSDGTFGLTISYTGAEPGAAVEVFRKGWGVYPAYPLGAEPTVPASPANAINEGWVLTTVVNSGEVDETTARNCYYYVAFLTDACGNISLPSNLTLGVLNYFLGDISDGVTPCQGDNRVSTADVSLLGSQYGSCLLSPGAECADYGPTVDGLVTSCPTPDGCVDFEDLILIAINFGVIGKAPQRINAPATRNHVSIRDVRDTPDGQFVDVDLWMRARGDIQALSVNLDWNDSVVRPLDFDPGDLWESQPGGKLLLSPQPGTVDGALLGARDTALAGEGRLVTARFARISAGDPGILLGKIDARDRDNQAVQVQVGGTSARNVSQISQLHPPVPNPFNPRTSIAFTLAQSGYVRLSIYTPNGRLVRTLVDGPRSEGRVEVEWDGIDSQGRRVSSGSYLVRLRAVDRTQSRSILLLK